MVVLVVLVLLLVLVCVCVEGPASTAMQASSLLGRERPSGWQSGSVDSARARMPGTCFRLKETCYKGGLTLCGCGAGCFWGKWLGWCSSSKETWSEAGVKAPALQAALAYQSPRSLSSTEP